MLLFVVCFIDEGWVEMTVHAKKGSMPLTFRFGLGGERAAVDLGWDFWAAVVVVPTATSMA